MLLDTNTIRSINGQKYWGKKQFSEYVIRKNKL